MNSERPFGGFGRYRSETLNGEAQMEHEDRYDVFLSYVKEDLNRAHMVAEKLQEYRVKVFVADDTLTAFTRGTNDWQQALMSHLKNSRLFVLVCSRTAESSRWVSEEIDTFKQEVYDSNHDCKMFLLETEKHQQDECPKKLEDFLKTPDTEKLVHDVNTALMHLYHREVLDLRRELLTTKQTYDSNIDDVENQLRVRFEHYGQRRFWSPFTKNENELHIFTCGRDAPSVAEAGRGHGGRTNIDKWDYRSVLEITHYFSEHFPTTRVRIEDPEAKLTPSDLTGPTAAPSIVDLIRKLEGKDCVIIGSPDVSDFAELVIAKIHGLPPFGPNREKQRGFAILKTVLTLPGVTYWKKEAEEKEGLKWIEKNEIYEPREAGNKGKSYGILVVCNNPFSAPDQAGPSRRILILGGFTGVATYGIAKLLTSALNPYRESFYYIDREDLTEKNYELLIKVNYHVGTISNERDTRAINDAEPPTLEASVEI